jgi:hypothetical protein
MYNWILNRPIIRNRSFFVYNPYDDIPVRTQSSSATELEASKTKKFLQFTAAAVGTYPSKLLKTPTLNLQWLSHISEFADMHPLAEPQGDIIGSCYRNEKGRKEIFPLTGQYKRNEKIFNRSGESVPTSILAIVENLKALNEKMPRERIIEEQIVRRGPYVWTIPMFGLLVRNLKDCIKAVLLLKMSNCTGCSFFTSMVKRESIPEGWKRGSKGKKNRLKCAQEPKRLVQWGWDFNHLELMIISSTEKPRERKRFSKVTLCPRRRALGRNLLNLSYSG